MKPPYPSRGSQPEQPLTPPRSMLTAVKLMYAGAALSAVELILALSTIGGLRSAIQKANPTYSPSRVHGLEVSYVASGVITQLIAIGLWILISQANSRGRNWARMAASGLFALYTLLLVFLIRQPSVSLGLAFDILTWLVGLGAVVLLWRRESSDFYQAAAESRQN